MKKKFFINIDEVPDYVEAEDYNEARGLVNSLIDILEEKELFGDEQNA